MYLIGLVTLGVGLSTVLDICTSAGSIGCDWEYTVRGANEMLERISAIKASKIALLSDCLNISRFDGKKYLTDNLYFIFLQFESILMIPFYPKYQYILIPPLKPSHYDVTGLNFGVVSDGFYAVASLWPALLVKTGANFYIVSTPVTWSAHI